MFTNMQLYAYGTMVSSSGLRPGAGDWVAFADDRRRQRLSLSISLVLKLTDNVTKSFASSASVILAAVLDGLLRLRAHERSGIGTVVVGCAFHLFFSSENERIERDAVRRPEARARSEAEAERAPIQPRIPREVLCPSTARENFFRSDAVNPNRLRWRSP